LRVKNACWVYDSTVIYHLSVINPCCVIGRNLRMFLLFQLLFYSYHLGLGLDWCLIYLYKDPQSLDIQCFHLRYKRYKTNTKMIIGIWGPVSHRINRKMSSIKTLWSIFKLKATSYALMLPTTVLVRVIITVNILSCSPNFPTVF